MCLNVVCKFTDYFHVQLIILINYIEFAITKVRTRYVTPSMLIAISLRDVSSGKLERSLFTPCYLVYINFEFEAFLSLVLC